MKHRIVLCAAVAMIGAASAASGQILPKGNQPASPAPTNEPRNAPPTLGQVAKPAPAPADPRNAPSPSGSAAGDERQSTPDQAGQGTAAGQDGKAAVKNDQDKATVQSGDQGKAADATAKGGGADHAAADNMPEDQGYPLKGGGTYKPPAHYPTSPAQDYSAYGRT